MKSAVLAASLLAAATGTASAGTYLGFGIGTAPAVSEDTDVLDSSSRSAKILLGTRMGQFSVEGGLGGFDVTRTPDGGIKFGSVYQLSGALKLNFPLGNHFEAFGRAGLHHSMLRAGFSGNTQVEPSELNASGNGILIGGGFEYRLNLGIGAGSIFVDYQINKATLTGDRNDQLTYDLTTRMWTLGLTIGL